jgi:hypothetical protein
MRTIRFSVVNKSTHKAIFTHYSRTACERFIAQLDNAESYAIGYKWLSI